MARALTLDQIIELKAYVRERFSEVIVHTHDACGAQMFSLEGDTNYFEAAIADILAYLNARGYRVKVGQDNKQFWLA